MSNMSIGKNMISMRRMMQDQHIKPNTCIAHTCGFRRYFNEQEATLIYAIKPPSLKQGDKRGLKSKIANKIILAIGGSSESVKKIWRSESHKNVFSMVKKLDKSTLLNFAEQCGITEPYLADILKKLK